MKMIELVNMLLSGVVAFSLAAIAVQLGRLAGQFNSLTPPLRKYLNECWDQDQHPPHHFFATTQDLLVWEWRDNSWRLRTSGVPAGEAGPPPSRAGSYDGECVTTRGM